MGGFDSLDKPSNRDKAEDVFLAFCDISSEVFIGKPTERPRIVLSSRAVI